MGSIADEGRSNRGRGSLTATVPTRSRLHRLSRCARAIVTLGSLLGVAPICVIANKSVYQLIEPADEWYGTADRYLGQNLYSCHTKGYLCQWKRIRTGGCICPQN